MGRVCKCNILLCALFCIGVYSSFGQTVSGRVFEDINYGGGAGRTYTAADNSASALSGYSSGDIGVSGVTVELWDATGTTLLGSTATNTSGVYNISVQFSTTYRIRVVNTTVQSNRPYVSGASNVELGVQTFRVESTDGVGTLVNVANEVGGRSPMNTDSAAGVFSGAQSWSVVSIPASTSVSDIDFGFNFSTIVNTNDSGQGSLRQFILNSNKLDNSATDLAQDGSGISPGNETSIFMIPSSTDPLSRAADANFQTSGDNVGTMLITLNSGSDDLVFTDNHTVLDGTTQTTNIGDTNSGQLGTGGTVGTDMVPFDRFDRKEILINLSTRALEVETQDITVRGLAVYNGGSISGDGGNNNAALWVKPTVIDARTVIEDNIFGYLGNGNTPNAADLANQKSALRIESVATAERNLFGNYTVYDVLVFSGAANRASGTLVRGNESAFKTNPDFVYVDTYAIYEENVTVENNLLKNFTRGSNSFGVNGGAGIELYTTAINVIIRNNTIDGMPVSGIYIASASNNCTITKNIIRNGTGVSNITGSGIGILGGVRGGTTTGTLISQNSISNNASIGIDLSVSQTEYGVISKNDDGDSDGGANGQRNFPILSEASLNGTNLTIKGFSQSGATIEFFIADTDVNGSASPGDNTFGNSNDYGEGQVYLFTLVEGSANDVDNTTGSYNFDGNIDTNINKFETTFDVSTLTLPSGFSIAKSTVITSTATVGNNTSEFSPTLSVINPFDYDCDGIDDVNDLDDDNDGIPDTIEGSGDFDGDGIPNDRDLDSDGDGMLDIQESGVPNISSLDTNNDGQIDTPVGNNGLANAVENNDSSTATITYIVLNTESSEGSDFLDIDSDNDGIIDNIEAQSFSGHIAPSGSDVNSNGIDDIYESNPITALNTDTDSIPNHLDIDSDNDGIPDNVEGQSTSGYQAPSGNDSDGDGLDDNYDNVNSSGLVPTNTSATTPDYLNSNSDADSLPDIQENGMANAASGTDTDNDGLDDVFEGSNINDGYDVNDEINAPATDLPNTNATGDVDYRESDVKLGPYDNGGLWLRGDTGLTANAWFDVSGYNRNFIKSSFLGFNLTDSALNFNRGGTTNVFFSPLYIYTGTIDPRSMFIVYNDVSINVGTTPFTNDTGIGDGHTDETQLFGTTTPASVTFLGSNYVNGRLVPSGNISRPDNFEMHSRIFSANPSPNSETYYLGSDNTLVFPNTGVIDGTIMEVIIYSDVILPLERQVVETYLGVKYGFTLDATDSDGSITEGNYVLSDETTVVWDYVANSTYHNNVAGIGKDDEWNLLQKQSISSNQDAFVTIALGDIAPTNPSNNTTLDNKEYLMWGHNGAALGTTTSTIPNVPTQAQCVSNETLDRVWKIVETGTVGTVEVGFTKSMVDNYFTTFNSQKVLVIADDAALSNNVVEVELEVETVNSIEYLSGKYDFNGTKYFTIADKKEITWSGSTSTWARGSGASNNPNTNDDGRLLIIDAQGTSNHASLTENVEVKCAYITSGSKLVVGTDKYLEIADELVLEGEIRLVGDGQLVQTHSSTSKVTGSGKLFKDQQAKVPSIYRYHYWSSPVVEVGGTTFRVGEVMRDGIDPTSETSIPQPITWTSGLDGAPGSGTYPSSYTPITVSNHWINTILNDVGDGDLWEQKLETGVINRGQGFTMKSTGTNPQNFTFEGTPNDGNITFSINPDPATHLLGNPYPSALNITTFITDNLSSIDGTLYFWEHTGEDIDNPSGAEGHYQNVYQGGYSIRNLAMGIAANGVVTTPTATFDWETATDNGSNVTEVKPITIDNTTYNIMATVTINDTFGVDIVDKQGAGGSTGKVVVKNAGLSNKSFTVTFDTAVDISSIYLFNDIQNTGTSSVTISADNSSANTDVTQTLTNNNGQTFVVNWEDVNSFTISTSTTTNLVLDNIIFTKGGGISLGQGTYHAPTEFMAVGQGFFVSASATGGQITFNNGQRVYRNDDYNNGGTFFFRGDVNANNNQNSTGIPVVKLGLNYSNENNVDLHRQIGISFKNGNSFYYDNGYDSPIIDTGPTDMYWEFDEIPDEKLVIAGVQEISDELRVPLTLEIVNNQSVTITIDEKQYVEREVYLEDRLLGIFYNIENPVSLELTDGVYKDRFFLAFSDTVLSVEDPNSLDNEVRLFMDQQNGEIVVINLQNIEINSVAVYSILGQEVQRWKDLETTNLLRLPTRLIAGGIYIVKTTTLKGDFSTKIFVED